MDDTGARDHHIDFAGADRLHIPLAVAVREFALQQIGQSGKTDMRVRSGIDTFALAEAYRAETVEEDEGADHLPHRRRQCPTNREAAEIAA